MITSITVAVTGQVIPPFLLLRQAHEMVGFALSAVTWLVSTASIVGIAYKDDAGILLLDAGADTFNDIYIKPWCRIGPYIIGLVAGYLLYKFRRSNKRFHWSVVVVMWAVSAATALAVIYGLTDYYQDPKNKPTLAAKVIYLAYSR